MSASTNRQRDTIGPKTDRAKAETALDLLALDRAVSFRGMPPAIGWGESHIKQHP